MSGRALRAEFEALQVRERQARELLAASEDALRAEAVILEQEVEALEKALQDGEARTRRALERRPVSQRVAAFGFQVLFVAPIVAMAGVALGRRLRSEREAAVGLLVLGLVLVVAWVAGPLRTRLLRRGEQRWRVVRRARALLGEVE